MNLSKQQYIGFVGKSREGEGEAKPNLLFAERTALAVSLIAANECVGFLHVRVVWCRARSNYLNGELARSFVRIFLDVVLRILIKDTCMMIIGFRRYLKWCHEVSLKARHEYGDVCGIF